MHKLGTDPSSRNLPGAFQEQMQSLLRDEYAEFIAVIEEESPPVSIRLNAAKLPPVDGKIIPWCQSGRYLDKRPTFTLDPHFHAGAYYVQEASSMFLEQAVRQSVDLSKHICALDLCAAPGGKSTHLLSLLSDDSLLVSNEAIRSRASILSENIQKWGYPNVMVTNNDPSAFASLPDFFDLILIDAPCSGEGLFRKDPQAILEWSEDSVALCSSRQRRIIEDAWPSLKRDGILIYCTCTYNTIENEANLKWLSERHDLEFISLGPQSISIQEVTQGRVVAYRFFPHRVQGEGFFISVMRKLDGGTSAGTRSKTKESRNVSKGSARWLRGEYATIQRGELQIAVPRASASHMEYLAQHLNVVTQGVALGTDKHGKFIPDHALALSKELNKSEFTLINLGEPDALQYLRKQTLDPGSHPKGLALVQYEGNPLGWANVLDNRINNLYPSSWRIKNL